MPEIDTTVVQHFLIALAIGALVGVEREKQKNTKSQTTFGGIRTFILFAQAGAVAAWLSQNLNTPWIFIGALAAVAGAVITGYILESHANPGQLGLTTELAAITVYLLGGAVMYGFAAFAVPLAILTTAVLAFKQPLHGLVKNLGTEDIYAGLQLLIATFIVLPLLPDKTIDPWQALNPYELWLLVVLISGLSLVGYIAVRWLGSARGTAVTGIAGGLVSSTAVSLSFARQSKSTAARGASDSNLAAGVLLAWMVMFIRMIIIVSVINQELVARMLFPFASIALTCAILAGLYYRRGIAEQRPETQTRVALQNPFSLGAAVRFGLLFAVVLLIVRLTQVYLPAKGLYVVSALAGLTDVDAITLSMAKYADQSHDLGLATGAITIAAISNTFTKCAFAVFLGSPGMRRHLLAATGVILVVSIIALWLS